MTSVRRTRQSRLSRMRWRVTGTKETHFAQRTTSNTNALFWGHELNVSLHPRKQRGLGPGRLGDGSFFFWWRSVYSLGQNGMIRFWGRFAGLLAVLSLSSVSVFASIAGILQDRY